MNGRGVAHQEGQHGGQMGVIQSPTNVDKCQHMWQVPTNAEEFNAKCKFAPDLNLAALVI